MLCCRSFAEEAMNNQRTEGDDKMWVMKNMRVDEKRQKGLIPFLNTQPSVLLLHLHLSVKLELESVALVQDVE